MRRRALTVIMASAIAMAAMAGTAGMGGCASDGALVAFAAAGDRFVNRTVGPEYLRYVEADDSLSFDEKRVRAANVEAFRHAVESIK